MPAMYRIIYSLSFDLAPTPEGQSRQLIVPLHADGRSKHVEHLDRHRRAIDLRNGDEFTYRGQLERVLRIRAYRDHFIDRPPWPPHDGYVYRVG